MSKEHVGQYAYDYECFEKDVHAVIDQLRDKRFDVIVAVNRGGLIPAVCISHALNIPMTTVDYSLRDGINHQPKCMFSYFRELSWKYNNVLLVDDLVDSGKCVSSIIDIAKQFVTMELAVLAYNTDVVLPVEVHYGMAYSRKIEKRYFDFWWEAI